ncbi:CPK2 [Symbiodinium sp. CCMP2456]|nr:CPK2 [Symbiodinium sp. CCMP2456]
MGGCGSKSRVEATQPKASKAPEPLISNLHSDPSGQPIDAGAGHNAGSAKAAKQPLPAKGDLSKLQAPADDVQLVLSAGDIRDKYEILAVLGSGSFGEVKEIRVKAFPDKLRAVKITERQVDDKGEKGQKKLDSLAMFRKEVELLRSLKHPNIVRVWDVYETSHYLYVVMDLCRGGELFEMINEMDRLSETDTAVIAKQLLGGIDYMHSKGVMHRDIKAENVLLTEWSPTAVVKIIDFGIAARFQRGEMFDKISGSPQYMAPELVGQRYDYRVDMWAFGVLVYFALYGRYPFDGNNVREILLTVLHGTIEWDSDVSIDSKTIAFLKGCLNRKPRKRTTAKAAMSHPWIMSAKKPDAEKHREPTEINISSDILKGDPKVPAPGTDKKAPVEKPEAVKDDGGKRTALRVRQDDPSAAAGIGQEATGSQGATEEEGQVDFMLDPNQALEFQDMYSDWKRQTSTDSTASSASQMYPMPNEMAEEEDEDVKQMKAELAGESDLEGPEAAGLPPMSPLRIGEGQRGGGNNLAGGHLGDFSKVVPGMAPSPVSNESDRAANMQTCLELFADVSQSRTDGEMAAWRARRICPHWVPHRGLPALSASGCWEVFSGEARKVSEPSVQEQACTCSDRTERLFAVATCGDPSRGGGCPDEKRPSRIAIGTGEGPSSLKKCLFRQMRGRGGGRRRRG